MLPPLLSPLTGDTHVHSLHSLSVSLSDVLQVYQSVKMVDIALMVTVPVLILMLGGGVKLVSCGGSKCYVITFQLDTKVPFPMFPS